MIGWVRSALNPQSRTKLPYESPPEELRAYLLANKDYPAFKNFLSDPYDTSYDQMLYKQIEESTLSGRQFGAREIVRRYKAGDEHASLLFEMGFHIETDKDGTPIRLRSPDSPLDMLLGFNRITLRHIRQGRLKASEALFASVEFEKAAPISEHEQEGKQNLPDKIHIRLGIDPWPDPSIYTPNIEMGQIPAAQWISILASGKIPVSMSSMFDHDLSHLTEFVDPLLMKATRDYYESLLKVPPEILEGFSDTDPSDDHKRQGRVMGEKTFMFTEAFFLPDISSEASIRELLSPRALAKTSSIDHVLEGYNLMDSASLKKHLNRLTVDSEPLLLHQGGAARDSYNYHRHFSDEYLLSRVISGSEFGIRTHDFVNSMFASSLDGLRLEIAALYRIVYEPNSLPDQGTELEFSRGYYLSMLLDRSARYEVALAKAVQLHLRPSDIVQGGGQLNTRAQSKLLRWVRDWAPSNSYVYKLLVEGKLN
jgi:hypothetical protein